MKVTRRTFVSMVAVAPLALKAKPAPMAFHGLGELHVGDRVTFAGDAREYIITAEAFEYRYIRPAVEALIIDRDRRLRLFKQAVQW